MKVSKRMRGTAAVAVAVVAGGITGGGTASADSTQITAYSWKEPAVPTATALSVSPASPAAHGTRVTLSARVRAKCGRSKPTGKVDFRDGSRDLGTAHVSSSGVATETVTPSDGSHSFTASFIPANHRKFRASASAAVRYTVSPSSGGSLGSGSETVTVTIPSGGGPGPGQFTLTASSTPGTLAVSPGGSTATGSLPPVSVSDTRASSPGWTVAAQASAFTVAGGSGTFPGDALGWVPAVSASTGTVTAGPTVTPGSPGLGSAPAVLGSATGDGTATLGAALNLAIPSGQAVGTYTSTITITAI